MDPAQVLQVFLFGLFAALSAALAAVTGPTYDHLLVPELDPHALFPPLPPVPGEGPNVLSRAAEFSDYLLVHLVDPAVVVVALAVAVLYLGRSFLGSAGPRLDGLLPRLVLAVVLSNFTVPIAGAVLGIAGAAYPVIAGFDGGAWQHWVNIVGYGEFAYSWDNGVLTFVLTFVLFTLVLLLSIMVALRSALLAVLLVLLPAFTLLWPIPTLSPLARRGWVLFGELAFLPCIIVIPLELAVGAPSVLLAAGYLTVATSAPSLVSLVGGQMSNFGFPSAGGAVSGGVQRGLTLAALGASSFADPIASPGRAFQKGRMASSAARGIGRGGFPAAIPLLAADFMGRGAAHVVHHVPRAIRNLRLQREHFAAFRDVPRNTGTRHL